MPAVKGFSIVELMVALLLGSLISIAATQLFLVNRQTENLQQGIAYVQDQGRFVLDHVGRDLMQAGTGTPDAVEPFVFFAGDVASIPSCTDTGVDFSCDDDLYDVLVIQVKDGLDCMGRPGFSGHKRYRIDGKSLICSYAPTGSPDYIPGGRIVDDLEAFQVLYGIDFDTIDSVGFGQSDYYTDSTGAKLALAAGRRIVSARVGFLFSTPMVVSRETGAAPASIQLLDKTYPADSAIELSDGRLYRVFTTTVSIRNLMEPS